jgi:signal transduction histidine kinase
MFVAGAAICGAIVAIGFAALWRRAVRRARESQLALSESRQALAEVNARARKAEIETACLRDTLDALPIPVWRSRDNKIIDFNRGYAAVYGGSREAVLADGRVFPPTARANQASHTPDVTTQFSIHAVIGGQRRLLDVHELPGGDGDTVAFALDRTDVESAQRELRRHIAAHAAVLETLTAAVAIFGPDKRLTFFNSAFSTLWDLEPGSLERQPTIGEVLERLHETRRFPEYADFRAFKRERCALFTSLLEPRRELMHLPDGRTLQLTISPHPFGGLIYVYDDVTDRLALECSYNTLAQVQHATLDHLFEGIAVYGGDGRLKLHNPAFRALWRLSEADVSGEPHIGEIVDKTRDLLDDGGNWVSTREEIVAQVTSQILASAPLYRRDGSVLQVASVPLPDGEVLLTYLDVSDSARIEQALRERNEALETAARLKAEFVANVSYELRTPLNTVVGFAEILHNQYFGPLNSSQREYTRGILDSAHQLSMLISDIVDLASIEASYIELEWGRVDVRHMLDAVITLTKDRALSRGLDLGLRCPPNIVIDGDERRLKQAVFNLISNAIKFTLPGGAIRVDAQRGNGELLLSVVDTGDGLSRAEQPRVSDQVEPTLSRTGSSLGLSLVKSLVELHGGTVEIETAPERGTRITCRLPSGPADRDDLNGDDKSKSEAGDSRFAFAARTAASSRMVSHTLEA